MGLLIKWLILSIAFWGTARLVPGVNIRSFGSSLIVSAIYATLCFFVGWVLFAVFSVGTLGVAYLLSFITWWIIGALMLKLTDKMTSRIEVKNFGTALVASAIIALLNTLGHWAVNTFIT